MRLIGELDFARLRQAGDQNSTGRQVFREFLGNRTGLGYRMLRFLRRQRKTSLREAKA